MKKEYIKPIIINIKICNDAALLQTASLYDNGQDKPVENIAGEGGEDKPIGYDWGTIWND